MSTTLSDSSSSDDWDSSCAVTPATTPHGHSGPVKRRWPSTESSDAEEDDVRLVVRRKFSPRAVYLPPEHYAVSRFYNDYILDTGALRVFDFLPDMIGKSFIPSCLQEALPAVALASASNQLGRQDLMVQARRHYATALRALNLALEKPELAKTDAVLTTIVLFGFFEYIVGDETRGEMWDSHFQGRWALMKLRGTRNTESPWAYALTSIVFHQMANEAFINHVELPEVIASLVKADYRVKPQWSDNTSNADLTVYAAMFHARAWRFVETSKRSPHPTSVTELYAILKKGIYLDDQFYEWDCQVVESFRPRVLSTGEPPLEEMYLFDGVDQSTMWLQYYSTRILLAEVLLLVARRIMQISIVNLASHEARFLKTIREMAKHICATIPFVMNLVDSQGKRVEAVPDSMRGVRAFTLLWPLRVAVKAEGVLPEHRNFVAMALQSIGQDVGLARALSYSKYGEVDGNERYMEFASISTK